ncbi:MAG: autorepressor SdpR family transcription factor [Peptococcia bacterium]
MSPLNISFKALADPTRRQILQLLRQKNLTAGEIAEHFSISKPSISHHLNILKQADLIQDERQGQKIMYYLNTSVVDDLISWFFNLSNRSRKEELE